MTSYFSWMAFSEKERRDVLNIVELFDDRDTRDELGLGGIRDAFADLLFPGITTIQTRARYFLFIPWIYQKLEKKQITSSDIKSAARAAEIKLIDALAEDAGENHGVIGFKARATLKRLPSNIYWQGLGLWGIRQFTGGQQAYHNSLDRFYLQTQARSLSHEEKLADEGTFTRNWHSVPNPPKDFPAKAEFDLSKNEANYLRLRIGTSHKARNSLLAYLVNTDQIWKEKDISYPWDHPLKAQFSTRHQEQLMHAEHFSSMMYGAALLYNLILSNLSTGSDSESKIDYEQLLSKWADDIEPRLAELRNWDRTAFWKIVKNENPRVGAQTKDFVEQWINLILKSDSVRTTVSSQSARLLIEQREIKLKGSLARINNQKAREMWTGSSGTARLNYRWSKAQRILLDILKPLHGSSSNVGT